MRVAKKYVSSSGVEVNLNNPRGYCIRDEGTNLRDVLLEEDDRSKNKYRLSLNSRELALTVTSPNIAQAKNSLVDLFDRDISNETPGRFYLGDYYLLAFVTGNNKGLTNPDASVLNLELSPQYPAWIKEVTHSFNAYTGEPVVSDHLDYPYDYPHDYSPTIQSLNLDVHGSGRCEFLWTVYGPATSPAIFIDGKRYEVDTTVATREYLVVDSRKKACLLHSRFGQVTSVFSQRSSNAIFDRIESGRRTLYYDRTFAFDLTLYAERSEPEW